MDQPNREMDLRTLREMAGHSRAQVAQAVGITPEALRAYELGQRWPKLNCAQAMADALGITLGELYLAIRASHARAGRQNGNGAAEPGTTAGGLD